MHNGENVNLETFCILDYSLAVVGVVLIGDMEVVTFVAWVLLTTVEVVTVFVVFIGAAVVVTFVTS